MSAHTYPVRVDATLEPQLSRWLWLVKWLLAIPHYFVLALLWMAFFVLSVVAFVAILFTGRYPRTIFDFNVGVLRWTWRVTYYAYGGLGTDQYPPFTLHERPDYPAHLDVAYPAQLSRGLVLVKWWLLAIPHYIVVGIFVGSGWYLATNGDAADAWSYSGGLIGLLVLVAAVVLLFTGRYPQPIFDLVLGLNRWVLRVAAYVSLMTDEYPPFRLDMGGTDPGTGVITLPGSAAGDPAVAAHATPPDAEAPPRPPQGNTPRWGAGRVTAVVLGALLALTSFGLLAGGGVVRFADSALRDQTGYLMSSSVELTSPGYAITSESAELHDGVATVDLPERWLGTVKVKADAEGPDGVFVGIARTSDVEEYLRGVGHSVVLDPAGDDGRTPDLDFSEGGPPSPSPTDAGFWAESVAGTGTQTITWEADEGDWTLVVMNADATAPVTADVAIGATAPVLGDVALFLLIAGLVTGAFAGLVLYLALSRRFA